MGFKKLRRFAMTSCSSLEPATKKIFMFIISCIHHRVTYLPLLTILSILIALVPVARLEFFKFIILFNCLSGWCWRWVGCGCSGGISCGACFLVCHGGCYRVLKTAVLLLVVDSTVYDMESLDFDLNRKTPKDPITCRQLPPLFYIPGSKHVTDKKK